MSVQKNINIPIIQGDEGSTIKQHFNPENSQKGIRFSLAEFTIEKGKKSLHHKLKSSEVYYILEGEGILHVNEESFEVGEGDSGYVPSLAKQFIENSGDGDLRFLCIVDPAWKEKYEIIL